MKRRSSHNAPAFTLVELLVVITIVSLLLTILIPSISQAKEATYIAMCGNNMRQTAVGLTAYCYDYSEHIPPSCSRNDGEYFTSGAYTGNNCGPFESISGGTNTLVGAGSYRGNLGRWDSGSDYGYANGIVLMWSQGYVPFDLGGARILWCPAERRTKFANLVAGYWTPTSSHPAGGATYGIIDHPSSSIEYGSSGNTVGNWTLYTSYGYRSIGYEPQTTANLSNCITKGSWRLSDLSKYCAEVDYCAQVRSRNVLNQYVAPTFSHGSNNDTYVGVNRLFYDGHAKWLNDPNATFGQYTGGGSTTTLANTSRETVWKNLYDVE